MKIAEVETFVVANPPPSFGGTYFVLVRLTTDDGIVGWGEAYAATFRPSVIAAAIEDLADQYLVGEDPFLIERFWRRAYGRGFTQRPDATLMACTSALEMACWDINGKALGRPVRDLLGGTVHESLRVYTYLYPEPGDQTDVYVDPDLAAERALFEVERGFTAVKFDPAGPYTAMGGHQPSMARLDVSERFVARIRDAVGDRADLLFGTHGQFTPTGAKRLARRLESFDPLWFEEPVPPDDIPGMAEVAQATSIPIATGERLTTRFEFARVLEQRAAGILQINVARCGGIAEGRKIASMAEAFGAQIAPHCYNGPIGLAANAAVAAVSPNFLILESIRESTDFHADLLVRPHRVEGGRLILSDEPGLGVEVDVDVARAHRYTGDQLHLSMADTPSDEVDPLGPFLGR
jgi:L-alanine-DL-glutamate epimerase-like enolase superfamily enzyme